MSQPPNGQGQQPAFQMPTSVPAPGIPVAPPMGMVPTVVAPGQMPGTASANPHPSVPVPQVPMAQLAAFYAASQYQAHLAQARANSLPPPQPMPVQQSQQAFAALSPQIQRQVHAAFMRHRAMATAARATTSPISSAMPLQQEARPPALSPVLAPQPAFLPSPGQMHPSLLPSTARPLPPVAPAPPTDSARSGMPITGPTGTAGPSASHAITPTIAPRKPPLLPSTSSRKNVKDPIKRMRSDIASDPRVSAPLPSIVRSVAMSTHENSPDDGDRDGGADPRRRPREEGFRGSMRGEIARLMYAAGDVPEPDVDSVDYVEDLTVQFLADLCRPIPPMRLAPNTPHVPVSLSSDVIRHRLASHSYLRKYLGRWDDMAYMASELQASRRITKPSTKDLIESVGSTFLGLDESAAAGDAAGAKRRAAATGDDEKRRGRPPKNPEERKKPGPKKGWKKNLDPNAIPKRRPASRPYNKKAGNRPTSASVAPSSPAKTPAPQQ